MQCNWLQNTEIGHNMGRKLAGHTRFHFLNPNGLSLADNGLEFNMLCNTVLENDIYHMGLMEVNLDTMCGSVNKLLKDVSQKKFTHSQLNSASSCIPVKEYYKPGGTISMTQGDLTGCIIGKGADKYR